MKPGLAFPQASGIAIVFFLISAILGMLSACATPAQPGHMVPQSGLFSPHGLDSPFRGGIAIAKVSGGEETNPLWVSKVGNKELYEALRLSLEQSGYLSTPDAGAPFRLEVFLMELKQPVSGFTLIVDSFMRYKLIRTSDNGVVYDDIITASYKATIHDAFYGVQRLKLATEGSIRDNIAAFLGKLHSLTNAKPPIQ